MAMTERPQISVVIPVRNGEGTIRRCLEAVRRSKFHNYELIVVDDGSEDDSASISNELADKVISLGEKRGKICARKTGHHVAKGELLVFLDADVVIKEDTLEVIHDYFSRCPQISAATGMLSKEHPNKDFFSQYKNLYMHYTFSRLPDRVTFLYGSIFALRSDVLFQVDDHLLFAEDTRFGQALTAKGHEIAFLQELQVVHLKFYSFFKFVINDFRVPYDWAWIFFEHRGWSQLGKRSTGFAHASMEQLISVVLTPLVSVLTFLFTLGMGSQFGVASFVLVCIWLVLGIQFFSFLLKERGATFALISIPVTFFDHVVMASGIGAGVMVSLVHLLRRYSAPNLRSLLTR